MVTHQQKVVTMNSGSFAFDRLREEIAYWAFRHRDKATRERLERWLELANQSQKDFSRLVQEAKEIGLYLSNLDQEWELPQSRSDTTDDAFLRSLGNTDEPTDSPATDEPDDTPPHPDDKQ